MSVDGEGGLGGARAYILPQKCSCDEIESGSNLREMTETWMF